MDKFPTWVFIGDIVINLLTAYYKKGKNIF